MTGELFLSAFLACMFAFVIFGIGAWQIGSFLIRRAIVKHLPEIISKAFHSGTGTLHGVDPEALAAFTELERAAAQTPPGMIPHLPIVRCRCGQEQNVPHDIELDKFLQPLGWKCEDRFDGWGCPTCVLRNFGGGAG